ncbi:MAG TPA: hypothetical protein VML55_16960 [Planctomycetaceae bacterium]|nr:hypothetical protein [Planctomycetaceae bacterium]
MPALVLGLHELAGQEVLGGAVQGERLFADLFARANPADAQLIVLDFAGIQLATSSFLRESVMAFRSVCSVRHPRSPVIIANANAAVVEELEEILLRQRDAMAICHLPPKGEPHQPRVIGELEPAQATTLRAVLDMGQSDAMGLARRFKERGTRPTKWNNRLTALQKRGILVEEQVGRRKVYRPVLKGLQYGT